MRPCPSGSSRFVRMASTATSRSKRETCPRVSPPSRPRIPAGQNAATLLLTASSNAPAAAASLSLVGRAAVAGSDLVRTAVVATAPLARPQLGPGNAGIPGYRPPSSSPSSAPNRHPSKSPSPRPTGSNLPVAGGKLSVPLAVHRRFEYPAAFNLKPSGHPELDKAKELAIPEKATNVTWELNLAETKLPEGEHLVCLQGFITGKYRNNPQAAEAADRDAQAAAKAATDAVLNGSGNPPPASPNSTRSFPPWKPASRRRRRNPSPAPIRPCNRP